MGADGVAKKMRNDADPTHRGREMDQREAENRKLIELEERKVLPTEPIRNPPPSGEKILTVLYTIWAEEHGVILKDIKITKKKKEATK